MFDYGICTAQGCRRHRVLEYETCAAHTPDKEKLSSEVVQLLTQTDALHDQSLSGLQIEDLDLSGKEFLRCELSGASFSRVNFAKTRFRFSFLDFSTLVACRFTGVHMRWIIVAGSHIRDCDFTGSELIHCNFLGIDCEQSSFDDSDLYGSCFTSARLNKVRFVDCNLKRVQYVDAETHAVDFKYSNVEDAIMGSAEL